MNDAAGTWNADVCGALLPATDRGNTIAVTADPAIVVPGMASASAAAAVPTRASASANRAVPPPAGWTLKRNCAGAAVTYVEVLNGATFAQVAVAGGVPVETYCLASIGDDVALMTRSAMFAAGSTT